MRLTLGCLALLLSACNSLFYYPRREILPPPKEERPLIDEQTAPTADGSEISIWVRKPETKRRAILLHFHGNAENLSTHYYYVAWLGDYGIEVILFDYRGYGRSPGEPSRDGLIEDGRAALRFASARATAAKLPLFVLGQSLGGAVAIPSMAEENVPVRALVLESTFPSYRRLARKKTAEYWILWPFQWPLSLLVGTSYQPEDYVDKITCPTVVIHGDHDGVVPFENGERLFSELKMKDKEFWAVPGGGHTPAFREKSPLLTRFVQFVEKHLDEAH